MKMIDVGTRVFDKVTYSIFNIEGGSDTYYDSGVFQFRLPDEPFIRHIRVDEAYERFVVVPDCGMTATAQNTLFKEFNIRHNYHEDSNIVEFVGGMPSRKFRQLRQQMESCLTKEERDAIDKKDRRA